MRIFADIGVGDPDLKDRTYVVVFEDSTYGFIGELVKSLKKEGGFFTHDMQLWVPYHRIVKVTD